MNFPSVLLQNSRQWFCPKQLGHHISPLSCTQISVQFSGPASYNTGLFVLGDPLLNRFIYTLQSFHLIFEYMYRGAHNEIDQMYNLHIFIEVNKKVTEILKLLSVVYDYCNAAHQT